MGLKQRVLKKIGSIGASLEEHDFDFLLDAPKGKVWVSTGTHFIVEPHANHGGGSWKPLAYKGLLDHISYGLEDCSEQDCEICNPTEED